MRYELLGWPEDGVALRLDYERFSYAGKFVMTSTGKAVAVDPAVRAGSGAEGGSDASVWKGDATLPSGDLVGTVAFSPDRTDPSRCWLRYVTVARDRRGEGIGPDLLRFVRDRVLDRGFESLRIAVNNPYAYEALHRAGFGFTGETTGIAELVLEHPPAGAVDRYAEGLDRYAERDLTAAERAFLREKRDRGPPAAVDDATED